MVIIDYLQLMKADGKSDSRQQEISTLSRYLKLLARNGLSRYRIVSAIPSARTEAEP